MKTKVLLSLLLAGGLSLNAQQAINQLSDGGIPWGYKHRDLDKQIVYEQMPSFDVEALRNEDAQNEKNKNIPYRFGYNHFVALNLNNSGTWTPTDDGGRIWRLGISSPGAYSINLAFKYLSIPEGGKLFIYNADRTVTLGAFTQKYVSNELTLGTELIDGDHIIVEYFEPANAIGTSSLEIFRVTHRYRDIAGYMDKTFGASGSCENNVNCSIGAPYTDQKRAVVCLVSGGSEFCTGSLINNTCNDGTPYVLTANHCGSSGFSTWVFRFNWEASGCSNPTSSPSSNSISGGTQRAANPGSDMSLVQINSAIPSGYNVYFAGWDRNNTPAVNQFGIHHPAGDIKKISFATGTAATASYGSATVWQTGTWTDGVTEPGSSGSPLFNMSGLIIGQLYGGPSDCSCEGNASCGYDYYGKLFTSWTGGGTNSTRLSNWLDPASCNTGATTLNGYDPNATSLTFDAQLVAINSPSGAYCAGTMSPSITIKNNGTTTLTSMTISYQIDGGAATGFNWTGSLATGATANVTMPAITIASGAHTYTATIVAGSLNGTNLDLNTTNNASTSNYTGVSASGSVSLPFTEGFEGTTFPPAGWTNENPDGNAGSALWVRTTSTSGFMGSTACAKIDQYSPSTTTAGQVDNLITPYLNLSSVASPINLTFSVANVRYDATLYDSLIVWITTDCGATWARLASYGSNTLVTSANSTSAFTPTSTNQWATKTISLNSYASQTAAAIRFQLKSGYGNNTYIDDINIQSAGSGSGLESVFANMISVYPNPASELIKIDNGAFDGTDYQVFVMNMIGETVRVANANTQVWTMDMSSLSSGTYLIKIVQGKNEVTKKVMVIR